MQMRERPTGIHSTASQNSTRSQSAAQSHTNDAVLSLLSVGSHRYTGVRFQSLQFVRDTMESFSTVWQTTRHHISWVCSAYYAQHLELVHGKRIIEFVCNEDQRHCRIEGERAGGGKGGEELAKRMLWSKPGHSGSVYG